ncbi:MAG TPA: DUF92 domain-containing protein [bacterium]|nr:DUF92 domain-containing protein [bacterium]
MPTTLTIAIGLALSAAAALPAARFKVLTSSGAWATLVVGTVLFVGGGWRWLVLVGIFSATSSLLTRWEPKGIGVARPSSDLNGRRWDQVIANGGVATLAAGVHALWGWPLAFSAAAGAIAAAAADTWATEVGRWSRTKPHLITTGRPVPHGVSGGITPVGTAGALAGALLICAAAAILAPAGPGRGGGLPTLVAGFSGAMLDSLLGATIEGRCRWVDNSAVNLLATAWGAGVVVVLMH